MKPDWQNKSYAKNGAVAGSSTMHSKLKVGTSSLHSKIAAANSNMPQAPKPVVRKFADGGTVLKTRTAEEIGDTDTKSGRVDPGSFDRRAAQGEKNLQALKDAFNKFTGEKSVTTEVTPAEAPKAVERFAASQNPETEAKAKAMEEPSYKADVLKAVTTQKAEVKTEAAPIQAPAPAKAPAPVAVTESAKPVAKKVVKKVVKPAASPAAKTEVKTEAEPVSKVDKTPNTAARMSPVGNSQKDIEYMVQQKNRQRQYEQASNTDTGDETKRLRDRTSTFVPGFGQVDKEGKIIPNVRGGRMASQVYGAKEDSFMGSAEKRYLQSRIDAGNLTTMERAQAKRAGLI